MKKTIFLIAALIILASGAHGQDWEVIKFPTTESITGLSILSPDSFFVVTATGKIARTLDGGKSWVANDFRPDLSLDDIYFSDIFNGYICGSKGSIFKTTTGGEKWDDISIKDTSLWVMDIEMFDAKTGVVIGMKDVKGNVTSYVYRTTDGGTTWNQYDAFGIGYSDIYFSPGRTAYILSFGQLNYSMDMGQSWNKYRTAEGSPGRSMSFYENTILLCGINGMCQISDDGGANWRQSQQTPGVVFTASQLVNTKEGYISGLDGILLRTIDGGYTWTKETPSKSFDILEFGISDGKIIAVGTDGGILSKKVK